MHHIFSDIRIDIIDTSNTGVTIPRMIYLQNIKDAMELRKISVQKLSEKTGIGVSSLHKTLNGTQALRMDVMDKIAKILKTTVTELTNTETHKTLTKVKPLDDLVRLFYAFAWSGDIGYRRLKPYFLPNYYVEYIDREMKTKERNGPDLRQELHENYENSILSQQSTVATITSSAVLGSKSIMVHLEVTTPRSTASLNNDSDNLPTQSVISELIDCWFLDKEITEIKAGKVFKVKKRALKALSVRKLY